MDEDQLLRDLIISSSSEIKIDSPTILSLQDTVDYLVKRFGNDWRKNDEAVDTVIFASNNFKSEHVKEIIPDLYDLHVEYRDTKSIKGKYLNKYFGSYAIEAMHRFYYPKNFGEYERSLRHENA